MATAHSRINLLVQHPYRPATFTWCFASPPYFNGGKVVEIVVLKFETSTDVRIRNTEIVIRIRINEAAQRPVIRITAKQQHANLNPPTFCKDFYIVTNYPYLKSYIRPTLRSRADRVYNVKNLVPETIVDVP